MSGKRPTRHNPTALWERTVGGFGTQIAPAHHTAPEPHSRVLG